MDKISQYEHILTALRAQRYVSGSVLASGIGVSRTVVNRRLQELQGMGLVINAVTGKGYHLTTEVSLLDDSLPELPEPWRYHRHLVTRSTNDDILALATINPQPMVVTTEYQTAGKGRRGRQWQSSFGQDLAVSYGFPVESFEALRPYSLCVGVLLARLLRDWGCPVTVKWPNDLQIDGLKLAGILTELHTLHGQPYVLIGLGLNVNSPDLDAIDQPAVSLRMKTGQIMDRNELLAGITHCLSAAVANEFDVPWHKHWADLDALAGKNVTIEQGSQLFEGIAAGVAEDGVFLLQTPDGVSRFNGGQVRVRAQ